MTDDYDRVKCYGCGVDVSMRDAVMREEPVEQGDGPDYEWIPVPLCPRCDLERHGHDCPTCGETHRTQEAAWRCCPPHDDSGRPLGPPCPECGERMPAGSWGVTIGGKETVDWAECEACDIGWGRFTGFAYPDDHEEGEPA